MIQDIHRCALGWSLLLAAACGGDSNPQPPPDGGGPPPEEVPLFGTAEVTLRSSTQFDAGGSPNPFTGVSLTVTVDPPDGPSFPVMGYFDGNGGGGTVGDIWRFRIWADRLGEWGWLTASDEPGLDGESGSFRVVGSSGPGPVEVDPQFPEHFRRPEGERLLLAGDWLVSVTQPPDGKVPLNHLASGLSSTDRQALRAFHAEQGLNLYSLFLQNDGDLGHEVVPFLDGDEDRYDLARWHQWEDELSTLESAGLTLELWLSSDEPHDLSDEQFERFVDYAYARLGSRQALWVLGLEVDEYWSSDQRRRFGRHFQGLNVYGRPLTVHFTRDNGDRDEDWVDYVAVQYGFAETPAEMKERSEDNRDVGKPLYAAEFARWDTPDEEARRNLWTAFVAGAAAVGNGPGPATDSGSDGYRHFTAYVNGEAAPGSRPEWWRMRPADALVATGQAHVLREAGVRYLVYLPAGGAMGLDLSEAEGELSYDWYDPRTGAVEPGGTVEGGAVVPFEAPDGDDWLLDLRP